MVAAPFTSKNVLSRALTSLHTVTLTSILQKEGSEDIWFSVVKTLCKGEDTEKILIEINCKTPCFLHPGFSLQALPTRKILEGDYITSYQMCYRKMYFKDSYGKVNKGAEDLRLVNLFICGQKEI